jgi:hypothetical protein
MCLHGVLAEDELGRDLDVRQSTRDESQDLSLAYGQLLETRHSDRRCRAHVALDQPPRDRRRKQRTPAGDHSDRCDQLVPRRVLEQESARSGT